MLNLEVYLNVCLELKVSKNLHFFISESVPRAANALGMGNIKTVFIII